MLSMGCWLPMLVQCSLLLLLQFYWPVNGWFNQKFIFITLLPKSQSHLQTQCCQCVVGCQCLSNVLCSFCSNFIGLWMVDFSQKCISVVLLPKSQSHPQIQFSQCVVANACPILANFFVHVSLSLVEHLRVTNKRKPTLLIIFILGHYHSFQKFNEFSMIFKLLFVWYPQLMQTKSHLCHNLVQNKLINKVRLWFWQRWLFKP